MIRKSFVLCVLFGFICSSGAILLSSIIVVEEIQTPFFVYLGFIMLGCGFIMAPIAYFQDKIDKPITKYPKGDLK